MTEEVLDDDSTDERSRFRRGFVDRIEVLVPLVGYLLVTLAGVTTSSLGIAALRARPNHPLGTMLGVARAIRSDEWLTGAPIEAGVMVHGTPVVSPLAQAPDLIFQVSSGGFMETLLFFEGNLLRLGPWLPDAMLFAAFRAFPFLLVMLTLPPLLRRFGATRSLSWLGVVLTLMAPAAIWWSFIPVRPLAFGVAGSYLLVLSRDRFVQDSWLPGTLWATAAGFCIARLGTYYVPWSLTIGIPVVAATSAYLLANRKTWRSGLRTLATAAAVSVILLAGTFFENRDALRAELGTLYPGLRRTTGAARSPYELFGAPGLSMMQSSVEPILSNKSEISSALLVTAVCAILLWAHRRPSLSASRVWATRVFAAFTIVWSSWAMVDWGSLGTHVPGLNLVPSQRAAQTVGFIAALLACVVVGQATVRARDRIWPVAGLLTAILTAYGVSDLAKAFPHNLSTTNVWLSALVTGALVAAVTKWPHHWAPTVAVATALLLIGGAVNPILFGLGDLRATSAAKEARWLGDQVRADHAYVASDSPLTNALLVANGVPSLTGYQVTGPDRGAWHKLDPTNTYEDRWNRGASYLRMSFNRASGLPPIITNPTNDIINVSADPCDLGRTFDLRYIISIDRLNQPCLREVRTFRWSGTVNRVYAVNP
ncbi:MAG TPA: hypothetical protein VHO29_07705 [Marmoricola sp.]|nr:hypothetical protein [Marmoricola sp.]